VEWELPCQGKEKSHFEVFEYSNSREYTVSPDVVEYEKNNMTKPVYMLILGHNTMKELGIVLDF
jgi:hypothetical protein